MTKQPDACNWRKARRLSAAVPRVPIDRFDGFDTFEDLPSDGRCVADYWF
jgi:hypothetical protein